MDWKDLITELIELVKTAAPELWEILIKQVYAETIPDFLFFFTLTGFATAFFMVAKYFRSISDTTKRKIDWVDDEYGWFIGFAVIGIVFLALSLAPLSLIIQRFFNPEYYAIELLADLLTK